MCASPSQKKYDSLIEFLAQPDRGKELTLASRLLPSFTTAVSFVKYAGEMDQLINDHITREWWMFRILTLRSSDTLLITNRCSGGEEKKLVDDWMRRMNAKTDHDNAHLVICNDVHWLQRFHCPRQDFVFIGEANKLQFPGPNIHLVRQTRDLTEVFLRLSMEVGKLL